MSFFVACSFGGSTESGHTSPDASTTSGTCGDGTCAANEVNSCPADCGGGSNGGSNGSGSGSATTSSFCGDGTCDANESSATCTADCPAQGSGSGTLDCSDTTTLLACFTCITDSTMCVGVDATSCAACLGF